MARVERIALQVARAPWTARTWLATGHVLVGVPVSLWPYVTVAILVPITAVLVIIPPLALGALVALLACVRGGAAMQRSRFAAFLGARIEVPAPPPDAGTRRGRALAAIRAASTWRQIGYHVVANIIAMAGSIAVVACWSVGIALTTATWHGGWPREGLFGLRLHDFPTLAAVTAVGIVAFFAAPWVARGVAGLDLAVARRLLGPSRAEDLARRVESLAESRAGAVSAADTERRRLERDLHDGTQQRLTSLAMNLGMARAAARDLPEPAREALAQAHDDAKQALAELRDIVRGLHPAVLSDRGLDAALSGLAVRAPLPVRLRVDVPRRPSPTIEAVAYFVVSEALTNVAKHAHASTVDIRVARIGDRLRVAVTDDGRGGASPDSGTGLRGLAQRVASVDGTLRIDSPAGGPTTLTVELPCES
jgi:signal transduction histidine kinase